MIVLVDPEVLRAFAAQVDSAAASISGLDVSSVATTAADGLPASETQWAARQVGHHLGLAAKDIVKDITSMGQAVRGAGDRYEVDDTALAGIFTQLF
ncbi:type VII secretion target [Mycobacterium sp. 3519A]|uniref:type VII secretion target n=1 Tax=Mycobacterium sp. 3519A TaxID=2057184 RepID=UPI003519B002